MSTPRRRFFAASDSLLHEPWDNDLLACWVRVLAFLNTCWHRNGGIPGTASIGPRDAQVIAGKGRTDSAWSLIERLARVAPMSVERRGNVGSITCAKFAEYQGISAPSVPVPVRIRSEGRSCALPEGRKTPEPAAEKAAHRRPPEPFTRPSGLSRPSDAPRQHPGGPRITGGSYTTPEQQGLERFTEEEQAAATAAFEQMRARLRPHPGRPGAARSHEDA